MDFAIVYCVALTSYGKALYLHFYYLTIWTHCTCMYIFLPACIGDLVVFPMFHTIRWPTHASRVCFGLPNLLKVGVDKGTGTG